MMILLLYQVLLATQDMPFSILRLQSCVHFQNFLFRLGQIKYVHRVLLDDPGGVKMQHTFCHMVENQNIFYLLHKKQFESSNTLPIEKYVKRCYTIGEREVYSNKNLNQTTT